MTEHPERGPLEERVRAHCEAGELQQAASALFEGYGREILGFPRARLRDRAAAEEVFSRFAEQLWSGLPSFRWQCSARVWCYTVARHAASSFTREARRRRLRDHPLSQVGPLSEIAERIRTETRASARTENKSRAMELREKLSPADQTLLILRINRGLQWTEIAQVMLHAEIVEDSVLQQEAVRLRKRYQAAKEKLQRLARAEGLVPSPADGDSE